MSKDPAFLFYPQDFFMGTAFMTDAQIGKYIKLLCIQHQHGGLIDKKAFDLLVGDDEQIRTKFIKAKEGYYNKRLMDEIVKRAKKSENLSKNALKRWEKERCKSNANASTLHMPIEDENEDEIVDVNSNEYILSKLLFDLIKKRNPNHKQPDLKSWAKHIDLMIRIDKRTIDEIRGCINWSQQDSFWQNNILSTAKLRKQFDTLYLKAKGSKDGKSGKCIGASGDELAEIVARRHNRNK